MTQIARFLPGRLSRRSSPITSGDGLALNLPGGAQVERNYTNLPGIRSRISELQLAQLRADLRSGVNLCVGHKKSPPITYEMLQLWPANSCCWSETLLALSFEGSLPSGSAFELRDRYGSISNLAALIPLLKAVVDPNP